MESNFPLSIFNFELKDGLVGVLNLVNSNLPKLCQKFSLPKTPGKVYIKLVGPVVRADAYWAKRYETSINVYLYPILKNIFQQ